MGLALELITATVTAAAAAGSAMAAAAGNSLTVRSAPMESDVRLLAAWVDVQTAGFFRIRSPRLHDNVQGIRFFDVVSETSPLWPMRVYQKLFPQDALVLEIAGAAVAGDIESACMLFWYADLPGVEARLIAPEEVRSRGKFLVGVENTLALGVAGGYSGEEAINAEFDLLKANTDYALVGYQVSAECAAVRWRGVDTGNLGVGGPGHELLKEMTGSWFLMLSEAVGLPLVPVFNSANKAGILVDGVQDENGVDVTVTSLLVELGEAGAPAA